MSFAGNEQYRSYERLLLRLHALAVAGGESAEAESVREAMDDAARGLTPDELERLSGLSADLFMLTGDEIADPSGAARDPTRVALEIGTALSEEQWPKLLRLLRLAPRVLPAHNLAYVRARAYEGLGHHEPALLFMAFAAERNPTPNLRALSLELTYRTSRFDDAREQALLLLRALDTPHRLVLQAASVLYRVIARQPQNPDGQTAYELIASRLPDALRTEETASSRSENIMIAGYGVLGLALEELDRLPEARDAFKKATAIGSSDTRLLVAQEVMRPRAEDEFRSSTDRSEALELAHQLVPESLLAA